ncbi:oxidoreductase domain protein [Xylanimonas cellulosilytica DSM 15894]|uniref:Oxidoreductase domain protein n=1 Tax=Xylanimonas cellulosilytica (strain DSM 15894 / JCM 12276 / CECT 5975 / KCTC 9989 / LMG 20990 / NBRC 107835 / XIL07) TaxID=446471 RepID=D1BUD1_XYLCX|nr:Gfo/Idh/MocA family oxidoreductase [Xylanimonas cellulosilytica]ACZ31144.1 oxidoreductase domain protein [Xylanimonas cellulosilytica DSM 15894]
MRADLRVGVVGVGDRAAIARHVEAAGVGARVTAIADPSPDGVARGRVLFGNEVRAYGSHRELAASGTVDAVVVASPDDTHADVAADLLDAGIAVYLEKPLAITLEDADRVLGVAARTGTPLYVGHNYRSSAVVRILHDVVARGEIGDVRAVWVRHFVGHGGDYYFRDWHADRRRVNSLLLQKASHDLDVVHLLAGAATRRVVGMGALSVYGDVPRAASLPTGVMTDWFSEDHWPPTSLDGLAPTVDVEDVSMMMMSLANGVLASYEQCHFTPDYWRSYTVIGTEGRVENFGDTAGGVVRVWNRRRSWSHQGDREYPIGGVVAGHADADEATVVEFVRHVALGEPVALSPVGAREAVGAAALATASLRAGSVPLDVPEADPAVVAALDARARGRIRAE